MAAGVAPCGGDDDSGSPAAPSAAAVAAGRTNTTTITMTSSGVSPRDITVAPGSRVTFVNNDSQPQTWRRIRIPEHTDCPAAEQSASSLPGQSGITQNLNTARACRYHDHNQPTQPNLQGTIRIQ